MSELAGKRSDGQDSDVVGFQADPVKSASAAGKNSSLPPETLPSPKAPAHPSQHAQKHFNTPAPLGLRTDFGYARNFQECYKLGKELGHGQFGTTFLATDLNTQELLAVKTIKKKSMKLPIAVDDVRREVDILRKLSGHPNVVQFKAAFEDEELVYIAMEKESRYSESDAAGVVRQMLSVVALCHLNGVVHRDLKPENFLFKSKDDNSVLKATDFGLSDYRVPGKHFRDVVGSAYYVAPEVLQRKSGAESDVWSIGVIAYILLCGRRPFWDKTEAGIFNEVLKKKPDLVRPPWPSISSSAKDFLKRLLKKDPRTRYTAAQALSHPWVREGGNASDLPLDISVLANMRDFIKYSRLKQLALSALALTMEESEVADLRDQFNAMDTNADGNISLDEIKMAMNADIPWTLRESRVPRILEAMDSDGNGGISFNEFVAATLHIHQLEDADSEKFEKRLKLAFAKFDTDDDGFIDAEELRVATKLKGSVESLMAEVDTDGDGRISLPEFQKLLRSASQHSRGDSKGHKGSKREI